MQQKKAKTLINIQRGRIGKASQEQAAMIQSIRDYIDQETTLHDQGSRYRESYYYKHGKLTKIDNAKQLKELQ